MIYPGFTDQQLTPWSVDAFFAESVLSNEIVELDAVFAESIISNEFVEIDMMFSEVILG